MTYISSKVTTDQLPATLDGGNLRVAIEDGNAPVTVEDGGAAISVDDNGASLTVDTPQLPAALSNGKLTVEASFAQQYLSSFGRLSIDPPFTLADLVNTYEIDLTEYTITTVVGGNIVHVPVQSAIAVEVGAGATDRATLQTKEYRYQAGKGQRILMSAIMPDTGTGFSIVQRSSTSGSPVNVSVPQASWNIDPMDGTGPSGETLNLARGNIFEIRFQWLGVGSVFWFINGHPIHRTENEGTLTVPYMGTAQNPLTIDVENLAGVQYRRVGNFNASNGLFFQQTAAVGAASVRFICASVVSEGGQREPEYSFAYLDAAHPNIGNASETYLFSLRPKAVYPDGSTIVNRRIHLPTLLSVMSETNRSRFVVRCACTLTNPTWAVNPNSLSGAQLDLAASAFTGGHIITSFLCAANDGVNFDLSPYFSHNARRLIGPHQDIYSVLTVSAISEAGTADVRASISWRELR